MAIKYLKQDAMFVPDMDDVNAQITQRGWICYKKDGFPTKAHCADFVSKALKRRHTTLLEQAAMYVVISKPTANSARHELCEFLLSARPEHLRWYLDGRKIYVSGNLWAVYQAIVADSDDKGWPRTGVAASLLLEGMRIAPCVFDPLNETLRRSARDRECRRDCVSIGLSAREFADALPKKEAARHIRACVWMRTNRAIAQQANRHRGSVLMESQRYVDMTEAQGAALAIIDTFGAEPNARQAAYDAARNAYIHLRNRGVKRQAAREVLPMATVTRQVITMPIAQWSHFLRLRLAPQADPMIRKLATMIQAELLRSPWGRLLDADVKGHDEDASID